MKFQVMADVHLHFFGTSKLSFGHREWVYSDGDEIHIIPDSGASLINRVKAVPESSRTVSVQPA